MIKSRKFYAAALAKFGRKCRRCDKREKLDIFPKKTTQYQIRKAFAKDGQKLLHLNDYYAHVTQFPDGFELLCRWCYADKRGEEYYADDAEKIRVEEERKEIAGAVRFTIALIICAFMDLNGESKKPHMLLDIKEK